MEDREMPTLSRQDASLLHSRVATKGERTQIRILKASLRCLCKLGFEGASLSELAEAAKVNKGLMVHYFGTKERLFLELLDYVGNAGFTYTVEFMKREKDFPDGIERYVRATFGLYSENSTNFSFMVLAIQRAQYDNAFKKMIEKMFAGGQARVLSLLQEKFPKSPADLQSAAIQIHTDIVGSVILSVMSGGRRIEEYERLCLKTANAVVRSIEAEISKG